MKIFSSYLLLLLMIINSACSQNEKKFQFEGETQGTYFHITYYGDKDYSKEIDSLLKDFDAIASVYNKKSLISKINANVDVEINKIFSEIFNLGIEVSEKTDGAFDFTIAALANAWGFGPDKSNSPDSSTVDSLLFLVSYEQIRIENNKIIKDNLMIQLDFNAIAKGYSVDLIGKFLSEKSVDSYLVEIGGEVLTKGKKPDGKDWVIGIEKPSESANSPQQAQSRIAISNKAIATSGNYRNYYEKDGKRYAHTINPKTGYPVEHSLLSATVIANDCATADAYATAFMVMGKDKALSLTESIKDIEIYLIYYDAEEKLNKIAMSSAFEDYIID
jgi:FAD:protein FMN transferase